MNLIEMILAHDYERIITTCVTDDSLNKTIGRINKKFDSLKKYNIQSIIANADEKFISLAGISVSLDWVKLQESIGTLLVDTFNSTKDIELDNPKSLTDCYVETHFFPSQRRLQVVNNEPIRLHTKDVFKKDFGNLIILGDLGSGKTTLIKKLCQNILYKNNHLLDKFCFPILIRLRELNSFSSFYHELALFELISQKVGFLILADTTPDRERVTKINSDSYFLTIKQTICEFMDELKILLLFDGFDEINNRHLQMQSVEDFELISKSFTYSRAILTSRSIEFNYSICNAQVYEVATLNDEQIDQFIRYYVTDVNGANEFKSQLYHTPYFDSSRKPLALSHLCAIYERTGELPSKPKTVYKKLVALYIEEWDMKRRIVRKKLGEPLSAYNNLPNDRKEEFISKLAFLLTVQYNKVVTFSENDIYNVYHLICDEFGLPFLQAKPIVNEIEGHSGLIIQTSNDSFEFTHLSLQEYLSAEYISRMGNIEFSTDVLLQIPNELAVVLALVSEPNGYLYRLIFNHIGNNVRNFSFLNVFLYRLIIEKPDFKSEPKLGLVFAHIYTEIKFGGNIFNKSYFSDMSIYKTVNLLTRLLKSNKVIQESLSLLMYNYVMYRDFGYLKDGEYKSDMFKVWQRINNITGIPESQQPRFLALPMSFIN